MSVETLAFIALAYLAVASVWDIIDPDAVKLTIKPSRLIFTALAQVAIIWLLLATVGATAAAAAGFVLGYVCLQLVKAIIHGTD